MTRRGRAFGVLLVGSLLLVGCGGGDKKEATGTPVTTVAPSSGNTGGSTGTDGGSGITSAKCLEAASTMAQAAGGLGAFTGGDSASLEDSFKAFEAFAAAAPSEIRSDLKKVAEGYTAFMKVLADADIDFSKPESMTPEALAKLEMASAALDASDFQAAADRVEAWFTSNCGE